MIDTPQSIAANRNATTTNEAKIVRTTVSIIGWGKVTADSWQQQTINAAMSGNDKLDYRNRTDVYAACHTNAAYLGNPAEAD